MRDGYVRLHNMTPVKHDTCSSRIRTTRNVHGVSNTTVSKTIFSDFQFLAFMPANKKIIEYPNVFDITKNLLMNNECELCRRIRKQLSAKS